MWSRTKKSTVETTTSTGGDEKEVITIALDGATALLRRVSTEKNTLFRH